MGTLDSDGHSMPEPITCYMCDALATSVEHAPAKCIFPEAKDLPKGIDLRKNLIAVPSCEVHNTQKSRDDEYLLYVLPATVGANEIGLDQFLSKVRRAIVRKPALSQELIKNAVTVKVHDTEKDVWFDAVALEVDLPRILGALEKNARAIYFKHTGKKHLGHATVVGNFTLDLHDVECNARTQALFDMADSLLKGEPVHGANPEVFSYRFDESPEGAILDLRFYGLNRAVAYLKFD